MSVSDSIRLFSYFYLKVGTAGPQVMITVSKFSIFFLSKKMSKILLDAQQRRMFVEHNVACFIMNTVYKLVLR